MLINNTRGKNRYKVDNGLIDCYKFYKKAQKESKVSYLPYDEYKKIYTSFMLKAIYEIIENSSDFKLPSRLGSISIRKRQLKKVLDDKGNIRHINRKVDWEATNNMWIKKYGTNDCAVLTKIKNKKTIRYNNEHTNGYTFKVYWDKYFCIVKNRSKYAFKPCRNFARAISKLQKEKNIDYYEVK